MSENPPENGADNTPPETVENPVETFEESFTDSEPTWQAEDVEAPPEFAVPNVEAGKRAEREQRSTKRGPLFSIPGDKRDDTPKRKPRAKAKTPVPNRRGQFIAPLTQIYTLLGVSMSMRDPVCGKAIIESAESCATALDDLAYTNEAVRRALFSLVSTTKFGAVIAAHMPIFMAIAMHHVPAVQRAMGAMGQEFAEEVAEQMSRTDGPTGTE